MNYKPDRPSHPSHSDADLLVRLTNLAETIEPNPTFKVDLEAKLRQTHPANSSHTAHKGTNLMNFVLPRLNRRASLVACAALATAAALIIPPLTSERTTGWLATLFNSGSGSNANAQTLAQALETGQLTVTADTQEANETTQEITAMGTVVLAYPAARIEAKADRMTYVLTSGHLTLSGNVEISQRATPNLVAKVIRSRRPLSAFDNRISFVNGPYMSAVSQNVHPISAARSLHQHRIKSVAFGCHASSIGYAIDVLPLCHLLGQKFT